MKRLIKFIQVNLRLTLVLLSVNVLMYVLTIVLTAAFLGNSDYALLFLGADYTPFVLNGEVWRMLTSAFLHGNILHLALNMYALYILGNFIERFYGRRKLLTIYIITAIFGSFASLLGDVIQFWSSGGIGTINSLSIGASGALFGMVGVLLGSRLRRTVYEPQLNLDTQQLVSIVVYNLLVGIGLNFIGGGTYINIWAHFGGLIGGVLLGMFMGSINSFYIPKWRKILEKVLYIISVVILLLSFIAQIIFIFTNL